MGDKECYVIQPKKRNKMIDTSKIETQEQFTSAMYRAHYENQKKFIRTIIYGIIIALLIAIFV